MIANTSMNIRRAECLFAITHRVAASLLIQLKQSHIFLCYIKTSMPLNVCALQCASKIINAFGRHNILILPWKSLFIAHTHICIRAAKERRRKKSCAFDHLFSISSATILSKATTKRTTQPNAECSRLSMCENREMCRSGSK